MKQTIFKYTLAVFLTSLVAACSEDKMDEVNKDVNHVTDVSARYILTDVMTSTGFGSIGGDMNSYLSIYIEHEAGVHNQFYNAEIRSGEPSSSSTFNNLWGSTYASVRDIKTAISKCSEGGNEEGNDVTLGIAQVLLAYNGAFLADMFGDTPFPEAGNYEDYRTPGIDSQEEIYNEVFTLLNNAINNLQKEDVIGMGSQDLIYGGNAGKWLKAAYGLKARYTMHLLNRSAGKDSDLQNVLEYIANSFEAADDQMSLNIYTGSNLNPMFATFYARLGISASLSLYNKLAERNDPRLDRCYMDPGDEVIITSENKEELSLAPNGEVTQGQLLYSNSIFVASQSAPTHLLSYHELLFLKAEALYRLNRVSEAKNALKEAITASLENTEKSVQASLSSAYWDIDATDSKALTASIAEAYFENEISDLFDANPLKEIMIQKYLGLWGGKR